MEAQKVTRRKPSIIMAGDFVTIRARRTSRNDLEMLRIAWNLLSLADTLEEVLRQFQLDKLKALNIQVQQDAEAKW